MSALTDRDTNAQTATQDQSQLGEPQTGEENRTQEKAQYQSMLRQTFADYNGKQGQPYISPSDAILSPASQKLSNMKQRQMNKQCSKNTAARTLFARTASSCSTAVSDSSDTHSNQTQ